MKHSVQRFIISSFAFAIISCAQIQFAVAAPLTVNSSCSDLLVLQKNIDAEHKGGPQLSGEEHQSLTVFVNEIVRQNDAIGFTKLTSKFPFDLRMRILGDEMAHSFAACRGEKVLPPSAPDMEVKTVSQAAHVGALAVEQNLVTYLKQKQGGQNTGTNKSQ